MDGTDKKSVVWVDGCFDMAHFGHSNLLRQAKNLGHRLLVGVHSDIEIFKNKQAYPVFTEEERYAMVRAVRWVDEVVEDAPYITTMETLDKYNCDFCAHGDDITTTADGTDTYQLVKDAGRYREVDRCQGVSTTDLVKRMLNLVRFEDDPPQLKSVDPECDDNNNNELAELNLNEPTVPNATKSESVSPWTGSSSLLLTTRKLTQFSINNQPKPGDKIVYVAGAFDIFHKGHLDFLEKASKLGDFLIVGVHSDELVNKCCGSKYPIMTLNERVFSLLGCRYVSDVVIDAPFIISEELLNHLNVSVVAHGETWDETRRNIRNELKEQDPYAEASKRGILQVVSSGSELIAEKIVDRIRNKRTEYEERNRRKEEKEAKIFQAQQQATKLVEGQ